MFTLFILFMFGVIIRLVIGIISLIIQIICGIFGIFFDGFGGDYS